MTPQATAPDHPAQPKCARPAPSPVFILSPPRSYSTVSLALLAGHPMMFGFPETLLFLAPTVGDLIDICAYEPAMQRVAAADRTPAVFAASRLKGVARAIAQLHEASLQEDAVLRAFEWLFDRRQLSTAEVMAYLLGLASPLVGVEKTPDITRAGQALNRCMSSYPEARYLHLTRHPVSSQRSMREAWRPEHGPDEFSAPRNVMQWYSSHLRIIQALDKLPRDQWMRVRAEDLLGAPHIWLPRILAWLQLEWDDRIIARMTRTEKWLFALDSDLGLQWGGDWKFFANPALRPVPGPAAALVDPEWKIPQEGFRRVTALARYLGY